MIADKVYDLVTDNLFLRIRDVVDEASGSELFLKIEGLNPAGSIKLKTATALVEDAEQRGRLRPGGRVVESSSGNLGVALSAVCAAKGYQFVCITDPNATRQSVATMRALGAEVIVVDQVDANGGFLGTRLDLINRMLAEDPDLVWVNQYANAANPRVHSLRTASAVLAEIEKVDYLFIGAGTTGTLMGCADHFRVHSPHTRIIAVDAVGSVTFGGEPGRRRIPGLGTSRRPPIARPDVVDELILISEIDAVRACRTLAKTHGLLVGGSTGSVYAAVAARAADLPPGSLVVAISADLGDKYLSTIYNDDWVREAFGDRALEGPELAGATLR